jgi:hypothetical protein
MNYSTPNKAVIALSFFGGVLDCREITPPPPAADVDMPKGKKEDAKKQVCMLLRELGPPPV